MEFDRPSEASLRRVLSASPAAPDRLQVKPKGFKIILKNLLEFLEAQQIPATLVAKLPRGATWKEDIQHYCQQFTPTAHCYCLTRHDLENDDREEGASGLTRLPIRAARPWQGEYFLIILAADISFLVTAYRIQATSPLQPSQTMESLATPAKTGPRPSTYLDVCLSINPTLIAALLQAAIPLIDPDSQAVLQAPLQAWQSQIESGDGWSPAILDQWCAWQVKLQENLRQSAANYRKQALGAAQLSSQNEVLLNTLRLKDDFLNTVGQELRTPLTTIKTALTLLGSPNLKAPQRERYMEMIAHECDRQSALIQGVLNLLQLETSLGDTRSDPIQLADIVPPVVSTYQPIAQEKGLMLAYTIPDNLPKVACPESWLRQIVIHLLNNSIRFTRQGDVWVTVRRQDDRVELEVRDTGVGIAPAEIDSVFKHFFRGRNLPEGEIEGTGLGLSIVQQLLRYCGGSVTVESQPGQGSTFRISLPLATA